MKKNLYKATFTTVIYCEDDYEASKIARALANQVEVVSYEEESVEEIVDIDELPCGWEGSFKPVSDVLIDDQLTYAEESIEDIFKENDATYVFRKRIKELESELEKLKSQLK